MPLLVFTPKVESLIMCTEYFLHKSVLRTKCCLTFKGLHFKSASSVINLYMHNNETKLQQHFNVGRKTACCELHQSIDRLLGRYQELVELGKSPRPRASRDLADVCGSKVHNSCFLPFSSPPPGFLAACSVSHVAVITFHPNVCVAPPTFVRFYQKEKKLNLAS